MQQTSDTSLLNQPQCYTPTLHCRYVGPLPPTVPTHQRCPQTKETATNTHASTNLKETQKHPSAPFTLASNSHHQSLPPPRDRARTRRFFKARDAFSLTHYTILDPRSLPYTVQSTFSSPCSQFTFILNFTHPTSRNTYTKHLKPAHPHFYTRTLLSNETQDAHRNLM